MTDLKPNTRYYYRVGDPYDGWSTVFTFLTLPEVGDLSTPLTLAVYGDLGDGNAQALSSVQTDAQQGVVHAVVHVGDFAYDMDHGNGAKGDQFMRDIEPIAANLPYMTCHGNHEWAYNFGQYTYRFNGQPSNTGVLPPGAGANVAGQRNNWWFSFDMAGVHFVVVSTEIYFFKPHLLPAMIAWLRQDLATANTRRHIVPWVVMIGHRPLYCSCDDDCDSSSSTVRNGPANTTGLGLEDIAHGFGVDLYLCGHEHNYERLFAPYKGRNVAMEVSQDTHVIANPNGTVQIISGSAGTDEGHEPFKRPQPSWSAFRSNTFGYSHLRVHNRTHLYWEQIMTDTGQPAQDMGKVIDHMWLIKDTHGPF